MGEKVKELRESLGLNQKQLAEISGITQATISRVESGKVKELKSDAYDRLAKALAVTQETLSGAELRYRFGEFPEILLNWAQLSEESRERLLDVSRHLLRLEEQAGSPKQEHLASYLGKVQFIDTLSLLDPATALKETVEALKRR